MFYIWLWISLKEESGLNDPQNSMTWESYIWELGTRRDSRCTGPGCRFLSPVASSVAGTAYASIKWQLLLLFLFRLLRYAWLSHFNYKALNITFWLVRILARSIGLKSWASIKLVVKTVQNQHIAWGTYIYLWLIHVDVWQKNNTIL